jgi:hypothetical protein
MLNGAKDDCGPRCARRPGGRTNRPAIGRGRRRGSERSRDGAWLAGAIDQVEALLIDVRLDQPGKEFGSMSMREVD